MANEFLSQEEINLLLKTLGKEEEKKEAVQEERIKPLDPSLFEHISAGRVPGLELIFERWINGLRRGLTSIIVNIPSILKESVSLVRFGDFITKLPLPCAIGLFNIKPLRGTCLLIIDPKLIYIALSSIFGGSAKPYKIEGKDFTRIELKLIQKLLNVCYQELEMAWSTVMDVKVNPIGIETNPALLTVARAKEKFLIVKLVIVIEGSEGYMHLAIPDSAIGPYRDILKGSPEVKSKRVDNKILKSFQKVPLKLEAILGRSQISFKRLLELNKGDVLILDRLLREPLEVRIEGVPKLLAFLGQVSSRKALKIYGYIQKED